MKKLVGIFILMSLLTLLSFCAEGGDSNNKSSDNGKNNDDNDEETVCVSQGDTIQVADQTTGITLSPIAPGDTIQITSSTGDTIQITTSSTLFFIISGDTIQVQ